MHNDGIAQQLIRRAVDDEFRQKTDKPRTLWHGIRYALAGEFDA